MKTKFVALLLLAYFSSYGQVKSDSKITKKTPVVTIKQSNPKDVAGLSANLTETIKAIATINEVQAEHVGIAGEASDNYLNFLRLKKTASTEVLLDLTRDTNSVVACYASWALADLKYPKLFDIFNSFLKTDRKVNTFRGCIKSTANISSELYHRYLNSLDDKAKPGDKTLVLLDSSILYSDYSFWLLTSRALENRIYPFAYKNRIEELAFKKGNREAIGYLSNWYKAEYYDKLKPCLVKYLIKTDFSKTGSDDYYKTLEELFSFRDDSLEKIIIQKLKKDKHWRCEEEKFKSLLDQHYIYSSDVD